MAMMEGHRSAKGVTEVIPTLRSLYYEIASTTSAFALRSLQELADPEHILWGSDLPFVYGERLKDEVDHWEKYEGFNADERLAVEQQNALSLFPRFGSSAGASGQP
jgi:predicted TIM-barrel fold metal-dependent hydrolase